LKQIILGTAGHIDHGKTSLIKAITGTNTDRLKEEQIRGITIELGFASLDLPSGQHLGIVDVPGHEKFVKNMVAGATGIDIVAMVIAADEGIMPQTREHMEICALLGIEFGIVVLTKVDLVDEEWLELVKDEIQTFTQASFLENAPVVAVSSATGQGIPEFIDALESLCKSVPARPSSGLFRLPVDRVFTMKGFGTVITGSLLSGHVQVGDTITVYPQAIRSKVRGIQVHNESVPQAESGMRTAINFQGLEKSAVNRGDVLAFPDTLMPSYMVDIWLTYLASAKKPLKNRTRVRFHTGTNEILGNIILLETEEIEPGTTVAAQIRLDAPVVLVRDDRFVIRSYSPVRTIGGGRVINPIPPKHKRFRPEVVSGLKRIAEGSCEEIIDYQVQQAGVQGVGFAALKLMTNVSDKQLANGIQNLLSKRVLIQTDKENRIYIHRSTMESIESQIRDHLGAYHLKYPLKPGMPKEELKSKLPPSLGVKFFNQVLNQLVKTEGIVYDEDSVRLIAHKVSLAVDQADVREKILETYRRSGLQPPYFKELGSTLNIDSAQAKDVLMLLVDHGQLFKVKEDLFFSAEAITDLKARLVAFLEANAELSTPQFKEMTGVSRKYLIPLIEYFDATHVTIRIGDIRKLRKG
jgi:selenocysteine-specific elongation factor